MNTNQFLQTSRTVTFIIQKNKASIPDFDAWYERSAVSPWKVDAVMTWAKDARNTIEKEGDLELNSTLSLTLLFSYLSEEDVHIRCGRSELLGAGIKKLIRLARKTLPTGVSDAAVVKIERRWVTASLSAWELLQALAYVYARIYDLCRSLATQLGSNLDSGITAPSEFDEFRDQAQQTEYLKLADLKLHSLSFRSRSIQRDEYIPPDLKQKLEGVVVASKSDGTGTMHSTAQFLIRMAETTFTHFGNHVPMLFMYDDRWTPIDMISTEFADQADKYLFWRRVADRVANQQVHGISWISELWMRRLANYPSEAIRKLPIIGERLHITLADRTGQFKEIAWDIVRSTAEATAVLRRVDVDAETVVIPSFLIPIRRTWGIADPMA